MTEQQPQSAIDSQPKFQKPRKQKVRKDPNAPFIREKLELPEGHNKLLLHSCCAPCSGEVMAWKYGSSLSAGRSFSRCQS